MAESLSQTTNVNGSVRAILAGDKVFTFGGLTDHGSNDGLQHSFRGVWEQRRMFDSPARWSIGRPRTSHTSRFFIPLEGFLVR